jgi:hypothetical protein
MKQKVENLKEAVRKSAVFYILLPILGLRFRFKI